MKIWKSPDEYLGLQSNEWINWVRKAKALREGFDMALELKEDYIPHRITLIVGLGLLAILVLTATWLIRGGDPGNVSTVMSFVLAFVAGKSRQRLIVLASKAADSNLKLLLL
jgi:hypothetical protein